MATAHIRSNSFPLRTHPLSNTVEELLLRLKSSESASSSSSVCQRLGGLKDLYDSVDDWLQLSMAHQPLSNHNNRQCVEDLLDGSLQTLDVCGNLREVLSQMKESLRDLESSFRRKSMELEAYSASRKQMKKVICRMLRSLKKQNNLNKDYQLGQETSINILREVEQMSRSVFESLLCFLSRPKTRYNGWSLISKVVSSRHISCEDVADAGEVQELDNELLHLKSIKSDNNAMLELKKRVQAIESSIQEMEEVCDCIYRCIVKTRVALLNILDH